MKKFLRKNLGKTDKIDYISKSVLPIDEIVSNHTNIHLYIAVPVNNSKQYFYQGLYECVGHDEVTEPDKNGNERIVYKFILRKQELQIKPNTAIMNG